VPHPLTKNVPRPPTKNVPHNEPATTSATTMALFDFIDDVDDNNRGGAGHPSDSADSIITTPIIIIFETVIAFFGFDLQLCNQRNLNGWVYTGTPPMKHPFSIW
jgi:hypothetical protein